MPDQVIGPLYCRVPFLLPVESCSSAGVRECGHHRTWSPDRPAAWSWRGEHVGSLANQEPGPQDGGRPGVPREVPARAGKPCPLALPAQHRRDSLAAPGWRWGSSVSKQHGFGGPPGSGWVLQERNAKWVPRKVQPGGVSLSCLWLAGAKWGTSLGAQLEGDVRPSPASLGYGWPDKAPVFLILFPGKA